MKPRFNPFLALTLAITSLTTIHATVLTWDTVPGDSAVTGGGGTWDTATAGWTADAGVTNEAWPISSTGDDDASFGDTGGPVIIDDGGITANGIAFESAGYILSGGTLTLDGSSPGIATNGNATIGSIIDGTAGLAKTGTETLSLTAANTYTGTTNIGGGTLFLSGGGNRLATAGSLAFSADGTLDLGANPQTLANLSILTAAASTKGIITNGTLTLDGANALTITPSVTTGGLTAEVDASGLSSLTISKSGQAIVVGGFSGAGSPGNFGMFKLSAATNSVTADSINVGTTSGANSAGIITKGEMELGASNTINANTWTLGNTRSGGIVRFKDGLEAPSAILRGQDGTSAVTRITIGQNAAGSTGVGTSSLELAAGSVDLLVTDLVLSRGATTGTNKPPVNGYFSMGGGTVDASNIWLSKNEQGGLNSTNTSHMYQLAGEVKVNDLIFGTTEYNGATSVPTFNSQYTLTTGTLRAGEIMAGAGSFATGSTRRINFNGGTITHYDSSSDLSINGVTGSGGTIGIALGTDGTPTIDVATGRTVTLGEHTSISGAGSLTKTGPGELVMNNAANTGAGEFRPVEGSVVVGATNALAGQVVVLDPADSGTLSFNGTTVVALGGLQGSRNLSVLNDSAAFQDLTLGGAGSADYTGVLTGAKSIRKVGAGTQTYDPGASHTVSLAGLNVSGGTLELNSGDYTVTGSVGTGKPDSITGFVVSRGGTFHMNGANITCTSGSYVFPAGNTGGDGNSFILDSGTFDAGTKEVLNAYGSSGTFTMNGGEFFAGEFRVSQSKPGVVNLNGGVLRITKFKHSNDSETINFNGGTLRAGVDTGELITSSIDNANILSGGAKIDSNGFTVTIPKALIEDPGSPGGGLTKLGLGTLALTAPNEYTGPTSVEAGSLIINGDHSGATGITSVDFGAGLGGDGIINAATYADGAEFPWTVADWTAAPTLDAGSVTIDGELTVVVGENALANFTDADATFTILSASSLTVTTPAALAVDASAFTSGDGTWDVQQNGNTLELVYTAAAAGGYTDWADAYASGQSADLDHDNDGVSNGVEYFMGETGSTFTANPGVIDGKVTWPKDSAFVGSFKVQVSDTLALGAWTDIVPPDASIDDTDPNQVVFTLPTGDPKKFVRLNVVVP
jgi:fibronectin-binding autotransporter adhesin